MAKVSVIVPVYCVEQYIEKCARSLFDQTLDDIEYVFINDCSPDRSIDILRKVLGDYPHRLDHVIIYDMPVNSGQAAVRKKGIEIASGDYIIHCDSDDFVEQDMYEVMYEAAVTNSCDIVLCDINEITDIIPHQIDCMESGSVDLVQCILTTRWGGSLVNKLIKRDIVKSDNIDFPNDNYWEDIALAVQYALKMHTFDYIHKPLYYYVRRGDSIIGVGSKPMDVSIRNTLQASRNYDIVVDSLSRAGVAKRYERITMIKQLNIKNQILQLMPFPNCTKVYRGIFRHLNRRVLFSGYFTLREKLCFLVAYLGLFPLYKKAMDFFRNQSTDNVTCSQI